MVTHVWSDGSSGLERGFGAACHRRSVVVDRLLGMGFSRQERAVAGHHSPAAPEAAAQLKANLAQLRVTRRLLIGHAEYPAGWLENGG